MGEQHGVEQNEGREEYKPADQLKRMERALEAVEVAHLFKNH